MSVLHVVIRLFVCLSLVLGLGTLLAWSWDRSDPSDREAAAGAQ